MTYRGPSGSNLGRFKSDYFLASFIYQAFLQLLLHARAVLSILQMVTCLTHWNTSSLHASHRTAEVTPCV